MSLKISELSKKSENDWVFRDVSFEVAKGEIFGIFGASGSGKTVLLEGLAGLTDIHGGTVAFNGRDLTAVGRAGRDFQMPAAPDRSLWQTLFSMGKSSQMSRGNSQASAVENALSNSNGVLLLDNSFCEMDPGLRQISFERIRQKGLERGISVVFASNDFEQMLLFCDRMAVLVEGEIRQQGTPQEIYTAPASRAVALIAGRQNLIEARRISSSKADLPEFFTLAGEHKLFAAKTELSSLGALNQNVTLAIRPEYISISFGASFPEDNLLKAKITGVQFLGPTTVIKLDAGGLELDAMVLRLVGLNIGDECMVGLPPDRISVLAK